MFDLGEAKEVFGRLINTERYKTVSMLPQRGAVITNVSAGKKGAILATCELSTPGATVCAVFLYSSAVSRKTCAPPRTVSF